MVVYRRGFVVERPDNPLTLEDIMSFCGDKRRRRYQFQSLGEGIYVVSCISGKFGTGWLKRSGITIRHCILTYTIPATTMPEGYKLAHIDKVFVISFLGEGRPNWDSLFAQDAHTATAAAD